MQRRETPEVEGVETYVSVAEDMDLAGDEFIEYVRVRTRAEVEWLRLLAEWCQEQAERITADLDRAVAAR
ncbi:MAG: hypothetical protein AABM29_03565 [Actinomycetota bacterium]